MQSIIYLTNTTLDAVITAGVIFIIGFIFLIERKYLKKDEKIKNWLLLIIYLLTLIIVLGGVLFLFFVWGFDLNQYALDTIDDLSLMLADSLGKIVSSLIVLFLSFFLLKFSKKAFLSIGNKQSKNQKRKKTVGKLLSSITRYTLGIIAVIVILSIWGVNVLPALAGLGILGLVIGLGAQKFINDLIAGFFIIFEQHYDVDDVIEVQGFKGVVTDIGLKTTRIRNWKGDVKILANGDITNITNYSRNPSIAIVDFGIAYEADVQKTIEALNIALPEFEKAHVEVVEPPQVVGVINLGASSVDMRVIVKTQNEKHYAIERQLRQFIKETLNKNDIEIPFPQVVISHKKED